MSKKLENSDLSIGDTQRPPARLRVLGPFALTLADGTALTIPTKKNRAMLAILALATDRKATRERLCGLLWADRGEEQARNSLRQSLAVLRRELGEAGSQILHTEDDLVGLKTGSLAIDATEFLMLTRSSDTPGLREAASLYQGELLADTSIQDAAFEDWLASERRLMADRAITVLDRLAGLEPGPARIEYAKRLVGFDPLREASHRALMLAYLDAGENGLALKQFETCSRILKDELDAEPASQTQELRQRIVDGSGLPTIQNPSENLNASSQLDERLLSVAILPFVNLSGDAQQNYICDGIAEDIITGLARFKHLDVIARNSSFLYRGDVDIKKVGEALEATYVVEGSVRRLGQRLRITGQLIDARSRKHVWADSYDVSDVELFDVQDQVVQKIVATLVGRVTDASVRHAKLKPPQSLAAYELVQRANALNWEGREAKDEARQMLEAALQLDPNYATAHSLLAAITLRDAAYHAQLTPPVLNAVLIHALKAVEIDANDSSCHSILGWVLLARSEFNLAGESIGRALQLNPNNPFAMVNRGSLLNQTGYPDEAIAWFERVQRSDPYFNPSWCREKLAFAHFTARRYAEAADQLSKTPKRRFYMHALEAACHANLGRHSAVQAAKDRTFDIRPDCNIGMVVSLLPYSRAEDRKHLEDALDMAGFQHNESI